MPSTLNEFLEKALDGQKIDEAKRKIRVQFRLMPRRTKMRYYDDVSQIPNDFDSDELEDANIDVLFNGIVVGNLEMSSVMNELYRYKRMPR